MFSLATWKLGILSDPIGLIFFFSSYSIPFSNGLFSFTAMLTGMSWSLLRNTQGFGMQCACYIRCKLAPHPGIMARSWASCQPFPRLPSSCTGLLPPKSRLLSCQSYGLLINWSRLKKGILKHFLLLVWILKFVFSYRFWAVFAEILAGVPLERHFLSIKSTKPSAGWPDEFMKKVAQYLCHPIHLCQTYYITTFYTEKKLTKIRAPLAIKKNCPKKTIAQQVKIRPIWSPWPSDKRISSTNCMYTDWKRCLS
jgi:hypothetical protein